MQINVPELSLVVLIGPSGSGKSTFAARNFLPTEIVSSDACRGMISDDENDQAVTGEAFDLLHNIIRKRLAFGRLTVVDATSLQRQARAPLVAVARRHHCLPVAVVFDLPENVCLAGDRNRAERNVGPDVIRQQRRWMGRTPDGLKQEGFRLIYTIDSREKADTLTIVRNPLPGRRPELTGPFDIIGDVHGCCDELESLLGNLGYVSGNTGPAEPTLDGVCFSHPRGRKALFLGDLVDRGPRSLDTLRLVRNMVRTENALCVPGNHDIKFIRKLRGRNVQISHGLDKTLAEFEALGKNIQELFAKETMTFLEDLPSHYVLDGGQLVIVHAGMPLRMQGRESGKVRRFGLYGKTTGETDEFGLPVRCDWAADYTGPATVVYGHTPVPEPRWLNRTVNIDTGCVFGGKLTALRYPEMVFVSVPATKTYAEPGKPFLADRQKD